MRRAVARFDTPSVASAVAHDYQNVRPCFSLELDVSDARNGHGRAGPEANWGGPGGCQLLSEQHWIDRVERNGRVPFEYFRTPREALSIRLKPHVAKADHTIVLGEQGASKPLVCLNRPTCPVEDSLTVDGEVLPSVVVVPQHLAPIELCGWEQDSYREELGNVGSQGI